MGIVLTLTKEPFVLIRISLNVHGTRAVQKLIESLRKREEIHLAALRPGFLELIKDPSGNHVVQKCLQSFGSNNNKSIFDAAVIYCLDIRMQCHAPYYTSSSLEQGHGGKQASKQGCTGARAWLRAGCAAMSTSRGRVRGARAWHPPPIHHHR